MQISLYFRFLHIIPKSLKLEQNNIYIFCQALNNLQVSIKFINITKPNKKLQVKECKQTRNLVQMAVKAIFEDFLSNKLHQNT